MKWLIWLAAAPLLAHTMSMSNGDLKVKGNKAIFELRMPAYEVAHIGNPERQLFDSFRFSSGGNEGKLTSKSCHDSPGDGTYVCTGTYEFPAPVETVEVECRLPRITVPNHVHLLRASRDDGKTDQAIFDVSFEKAELRFRPPTAFETAVKETLAGMLRAASSVPGLLFLIALVLAARSWRELGLLTAAFLLGEGLVSLLSWDPAPRFIEAAMGLTVAYLAVEILFLPAAGSRWAVAAALGVFHGLYFSLFIRTSEYRAGYVLAGIAVVELGLIAILWFLSRRTVQVHRYAAMLLIAIGMAWFASRVFVG